jgi:predicted anti-sigma-YlaC factor YlaD
MNCETASELLPELLAGSLDRETELYVLNHLARCEGCRRELAFWAQVGEAVEDESASMPQELFEGVREKLFGARTATVFESFRLTGRALGLAGSACRLALSVAGIN